MIEQSAEKPNAPAADVSGVPFSCTVCGECCSSWNIPIEGDTARRLLEKPWVQDRLAAHNRTLVKVTEALYRLPLTDQNVCVFLADNKHCLIETREGRELKPQECKNFPFAAVRLPGGALAYDTSSACKNIAEKLLLAFQPIVPQAGEAPALEAEPLPEKIRATPWRTISTAGYFDYQRQIREIFAQPDVSPAAALTLARLALERLTGQTAGRELTLRAGLEKPLTLFFLRKPYGLYTWTTLLINRQYADPRVFGEPLALAGHEQVHLPEALNRHVNAFLCNVLQRNVLLTHGHTLADILAIATVGWFLVRWYARTLALLVGKPEADAQDLAMAIRLTERYYTGHQPRFLGFFCSLYRGHMMLRLLFN